MTKVLVVDDSSFARNNLRRALEGAGYEVNQADSGEAAVQIVGEFRPDVVTLDLLMPGLTGQETLKLMKQVWPGAVYIIVSADVQDTTRNELYQLGANAFLNKPVQKENLLETIRLSISRE